MTSQQRSVINEIEHSMLSADLQLFCDVAQHFNNSRLTGIITWGLMPYFSLFVVESHSYLSKKSPKFSGFASQRHERIIRSSRTRIKLLDDNQNKIDDIINELDAISTSYRTWFVKRHRGLVGFIRRQLQPDLLLFFYADHLICTSQVGFFNTGIDPRDTQLGNQGWNPRQFGQLGHSTAYEIGKYIGDLAISMGASINIDGKNSPNHALVYDYFKLKDKRSESYYSSVFNVNATKSINALLVLLLCVLNFLEHVICRLVAPNSFSLFKIRFITLYHVASSLRKIQDRYYKSELSELSRQYLREIFSDEGLKLFISQKTFRNIMVHYSIEKTPSDRLKQDLPGFGLIEHHFKGRTLTEATLALEQQIQRLAVLLESWLMLRAINLKE